MPLVQTDYGLIYNTDGTLCATLRPDEGRFGGAVAVEEGTTNQIFVAGYQSWFANLNVGDSTNRSVGGGTIRVTRLGEHRYRAEVIADCTYPRLSLTNSFTWPANQPHTISAYILDYYEAPGTTGRLGLGRSSSGIPSLHGADGLGRKTYTHQDTENINAEFAVRANDVLIKAGTYIEWEFAQVELNKPFATSFVDGTRANPNLMYDLPVLRSPSWTIAGWVKPLAPNVRTSSSAHRQVFWYWTTSTNGDGFGSQTEFHLYREWNNGRVGFYTPPTGAQLSDAVLDQGVWYLLAWVRDGNLWRLYVNGSLVYEATGSIDYNGNVAFRLHGPAAATRWSNMMFDELLILPYAASEQEIQDIYQKGVVHIRRPGYYAPFDNSIALQHWIDVIYDYRVDNNRIVFTEAPKAEDHVFALYELGL